MLTTDTYSILKSYAIDTMDDIIQTIYVSIPHTTNMLDMTFNVDDKSHFLIPQKTKSQLIWNVIKYLHMEKIVFVFKLIEEIPGQHSVPNQGHWLKLLRQLYILNHFRINVLSSKVCWSQNNWNNIWSPFYYTDF